jgi:hypothetical protein
MVGPEVTRIRTIVDLRNDDELGTSADRRRAGVISSTFR